MSAKIGEVIESSVGEFVSECYEVNQSPPLGSWVRTSDGERKIFAVVNDARTASIEPGRRPIARGKDADTVDDIYRQNPQLARLFRTEFNAMVVGHGEGDSLYRYLPPRPARIHDFVYTCSTDEIREFTLRFDFLNILVAAAALGSGDEFLAACLRQASSSHLDRRGFLVQAGKELAVLLRTDLNRLSAILRRIEA